ncbi:uncharacterized protein LOC128668034 [Microplitis demolitor]|uniref:uncharacterized protein LOC128668034 n=1 Tax=Microplitis demolitor TaxID=69319 RepID=UPI00235B69AF|nr:uncharacterized protein LOC128668034 [Microplitis demolitor]
MTAKSSEQLNGLINSVTQALNALKAQGISLAPCDGMLLTQLIQKKLDRSTREAWEHSLGSSTDFPKLKKLNEFLVSRARALERIGPAQGPNNSAHAQKPLRKLPTSGRPNAYANVAVQSSSSAQRPPVTSGGSSSAQSGTAYPCDMCRGDHYIVKCDKFTSLSNADRCQVVLKYQLCSNCLGHHRKEACRSKFRIRACQGDHHSMIHPGPLSLTTQGSNPTTAQ